MPALSSMSARTSRQYSGSIGVAFPSSPMHRLRSELHVAADHGELSIRLSPDSRWFCGHDRPFDLLGKANRAQREQEAIEAGIDSTETLTRAALLAPGYTPPARSSAERREYFLRLARRRRRACLARPRPSCRSASHTSSHPLAAPL